MKGLSSSLCVGEVMHRRYQPLRHELRYQVANLLVDIDELPQLSKKSWLFGYNKFSLFSVQDKNHGPADGTSISKHVRALMDALPTNQSVKRIFMFAYPAVFGRVFNPLTVYFGFSADDELVAMVYEVNNTFGQRHSYAVAVSGQETHTATKELYVSPFNAVAGDYHFRVTLSQGHLRLNIALFEGTTFKLCARFDGNQTKFSDAALMQSALSLLWQPIKVIGGIHYEALKLYLKGLRIAPRPAHAKFASTISKVRP